MAREDDMGGTVRITAECGEILNHIASTVDAGRVGGSGGVCPE